MINSERINRSRIFYLSLFFFLFFIVVYILASLRTLILPVLIGTITAYISQPGVNFLRRKGIPKYAAIFILLGTFAFLVFVIGQRIVSVMPDEKEQLVLRVQIQYKLNENYLWFMNKNDLSSEGNFIDELLGDELFPIIENVNIFLMLNSEEKAQFSSYKNNSEISERVVFFYNENEKLPFKPHEEIKESSTNDYGIIPSLPTLKSDSKIALLLSAVSKWIIMPFVFIFILIDEGTIKKFIISMVPNRYFEMSLTTFANVDRAIGNYLRGTIFQSSLVGITIFIGLMLVGFKFQAAVLIGIVAGIANAIPFLGPIIGLGVGVIYAMIVEGIDPLIPLMPDNAILGVLIVVFAAQFLDNAIFQPLVLGKAVNLHPLVVIIGVTGGSIIGGFWGMLLAIPTIVIFKVVTSTIFKQAKAYYIIY